MENNISINVVDKVTLVLVKIAYVNYDRKCKDYWDTEGITSTGRDSHKMS